MKIIQSARLMQSLSLKARNKGKSIGFVPTMGALHKGHLSLIRRSRKDNDITVVSIFVNPAQFGPKEDLSRYPRPKKADISLCKKEGVDYVFYPQSRNMYPKGFCTYVEVEGLSDKLCGKSRPGHFRGVATVVMKLLNIVNPHVAYFGQKDAQQTVIIKRMVEDLNIPVIIKIMPTVRETDGLALSSRNVYLNAQERLDAVILINALKLAGRLIIKDRINDPDLVIKKMRDLISRKPFVKIEYISIVNYNNLETLKIINGICLIAACLRIGRTRLIDNIVVSCEKGYNG